MNILHICVTSKWFNIDNKGNDSNLLIVFYVQIMPDD
ncbi:tryptophanase leader peptide, partial [Escherichia coli]|nr:tryptophanase leader peptide [Escherichia coli]